MWVTVNRPTIYSYLFCGGTLDQNKSQCVSEYLAGITS